LCLLLVGDIGKRSIAKEGIYILFTWRSRVRKQQALKARWDTKLFLYSSQVTCVKVCAQKYNERVFFMVGWSWNLKSKLFSDLTKVRIKRFILRLYDFSWSERWVCWFGVCNNGLGFCYSEFKCFGNESLKIGDFLTVWWYELYLNIYNLHWNDALIVWIALLKSVKMSRTYYLVN